ncbi:MAG TPA: sugar phosphate isomerase/epimerase, partial [Planctomycetes bacterium]|nr:sugar phosphate isomerase/epimerase [Planctomycetota bacterium]
MRIGICSWSLQAENLEDLIEKVDQVGIDAVQLAL